MYYYSDHNHKVADSRHCMGPAKAIVINHRQLLTNISGEIVLVCSPLNETSKLGHMGSQL